MVYKNVNERQKNKPRGRPFSKENERGKPKNDLLAPSGHESHVSGATIALDLPSAIVEPLKEELNPLSSCQVLDREVDTKEMEIIDTIIFAEGKNKLEIRFSKKHNRMYRVQIFLNDTNEIRPVTYTGAHTGLGFWNLLKATLKK